MKLADLLVDEWVAVPIRAAHLGDAVAQLLQRTHPATLQQGGRDALARGLAFGGRGEVVRINDRVVAVVGPMEELEGPSIGLAVAEEPFRVTDEPADRSQTARVVVLILTPANAINVARQEIIPALTRVLRDPGRTERLLAAGSLAEVRGIRELMETETRSRHLVEDALLPVQYRIYPDTPLSEVLDLMVRRGIRAVPVVGERYEVLGILTSGDALAYLMRRGKPGEGAGDAAKPVPAPVARDVMTRTVLCVSEGQTLMDAANMMVNRGVEQLPVVREGELVGFVTRDSILRALYGALAPTSKDEDDA